MTPSDAATGSSTKIGGRVDRGRSRPIRAAILVAAGITCCTLAAAIVFPHVTAVRVDAVARTSLSEAACANNGASLSVAFVWHGRNVAESDYPDPCRRYTPGEHLVVWVDSRDPTDVGPSRAWILDPASHDPFAFVGPNDGTTFLVLAGIVLLLSGIVPSLIHRRARHRTSRLP